MLELSRDPAFRLVYVDAPAEVRFSRIQTRGQNANDATMTFEEFQKEAELETEQRIRELRPLSYRVVENVGSVEEFYAKLDEILAECRAKI
jgi:dephospho-CoA kinase